MRKTLDPMIGIFVILPIVLVIALISSVQNTYKLARTLTVDYRGKAYPVKVYVVDCQEHSASRRGISYDVCQVVTPSDGKVHTVYVPYGKAKNLYADGYLYEMYQFRNNAVSYDGHVPSELVKVFIISLLYVCAPIIAVSVVFLRRRHKAGMRRSRRTTTSKSRGLNHRINRQ